MQSQANHTFGELKLLDGAGVLCFSSLFTFPALEGFSADLGTGLEAPPNIAL